MIQINELLAAVGISGGVAATTIGWLAKRQAKRIVEHCDDPKIHMDASNGFVRQRLCDERSMHIEQRINDQHNDICSLHKRMDRFIELQNANTQTILRAVRGENSSGE